MITATRPADAGAVKRTLGAFPNLPMQTIWERTPMARRIELITHVRLVQAARAKKPAAVVAVMRPAATLADILGRANR